MNDKTAKASDTKKKSDKISLIIMTVVIVLLLPILVVNLTLIIKGSVNRDVPPDVFGIAPMAVTSDSMNGERDDGFKEGALIFVKILDDEEKSELEEGDIVTFRASESFVTHRIVSVFRDESGNAVSYVTQGDANAATDGAIPVESVIGKCVGSVDGLGGFAMFMQTPAGVAVFIGIPVLIYIVYDVTRIVLHNRRVKAEKNDELREKEGEIERLRALIDERNGPPAENYENVGGSEETESEK